MMAARDSHELQPTMSGSIWARSRGRPRMSADTETRSAPNSAPAPAATPRLQLARWKQARATCCPGDQLAAPGLAPRPVGVRHRLRTSRRPSCSARLSAICGFLVKMCAATAAWCATPRSPGSRRCSASPPATSSARCSGLLLWYSRFVSRVVQPFVIALGSIPIIALAPIVIIWFGTGLISKVAMSTLSVVIVALVTSYKGAIERRSRPDQPDADAGRVASGRSSGSWWCRPR